MRLPSISKLLFFEFLLLYLAVSIFFAYGLKIYHNDAISRTALAFFTTFGRDPHLAAIGFIWQPLPSLLQLPFIVLLRNINLMMLSGPIVTSFAGAISVVTIYKIGKLVFGNRKSVLPMLIAVLFGINPMIVLYSSIGTSEIVFISSMLLSSYYFLKWFYFTKQQYLLMASFFISLSFWSKYESLPAFFAFCFLIILKLLQDKVGIKKIESSILQFALPFCYSVFFWILLNWLIMKDAFYFLNSPYSNLAFTSIFRSNPTLLDHSYESIVNSFLYVAKRVSYLAPILFVSLALPVLLLKVNEKLKKILLFLTLTFPYIAILLFHIDQLYKGESFGWLRFYMYAIVAGSIIGLYYASRNKFFALLSIILLLIGIVTTGYAMDNASLGPEERSFVSKTMNNSAVLDQSRTFQDQKKIAKITDSLNGKAILDTVDKGFAIPLFSNKPEKYVITSDIDYLKILKNYPLYVDWIIVPKPTVEERGRNKIFTYYPKIWDGKAPAISLYAQVNDWKIYKVNHRESISSTRTVLQCEYIVENGDSLWRIAAKKLGNGRDFNKIVELNKAPDLTIHPKQKILIPCPQRT